MDLLLDQPDVLVQSLHRLFSQGLRQNVIVTHHHLFDKLSSDGVLDIVAPRGQVEFVNLMRGRRDSRLDPF